MKVMSVVGARPNFMKVAPIIAAIKSHNERIVRDKRHQPIPEPISHILVHTGQHYDQRMSDSFFADLNLPIPDVTWEWAPDRTPRRQRKSWRV